MVGAVMRFVTVDGEDAVNSFWSAAVGTPFATASLNACHHSGVKVPHSPATEFGSVASAKKVPAQNFL